MFPSRPLISTLLVEEELWHLYATYGASPKSLFSYSGTPGTYDEIVTSEINQLSPNGLAELLSTNKATDNSHLLVTTGPLPNDRTRPERKMTSLHIFAEFCRLTLGNRVEMMKDCYDTLCLTPTTYSAAGMVFKYRAHQFLQEGRTLDIFPILASSQPQGETNLRYIYNEYTDDARCSQRFILPRLEVCLIGKGTQCTYEPGVYYRPRNPNSSSVDSWVLVQPDSQNAPIILAFQITINREKDDAEKSGLDWLGESAPRNAQMYHVILAPEGVKPEINASTDRLTAGFLGGGEVNAAFRLFHCTINTVELFK